MIKNLIIPMGGIGKRFRKQNFSTIKPLIMIENKSILEESIKELPDSHNKIAIINKKIYNKYPVFKKILDKNNIKKFLLDKQTLGQSDTCYKAKKMIKEKNDLFIHSCDYVMKYSNLKFKKLCANCDVIIFTYKLKSSLVSNYNDFAYCKLRKGNVIKVVEKKTISKIPQNDQMVIGTFWFKKASDFFLSHELALRKRRFINRELYIANNINELIKKQKKVKVFEVLYWKNLGDYFSYNQYIYWKNFFRI